MTGVARVVAIVSGDPQDPVLDVVQPVGCDFGAALREDSAPASARCRLARYVRAAEGIQCGGRLLSAALQHHYTAAVGAHHCSGQR